MFGAEHRNPFYFIFFLHKVFGIPVFIFLGYFLLHFQDNLSLLSINSILSA